MAIQAGKNIANVSSSVLDTISNIKEFKHQQGMKKAQQEAATTRGFIESHINTGNIHRGSQKMMDFQLAEHYNTPEAYKQAIEQYKTGQMYGGYGIGTYEDEKGTFNAVGFGEGENTRGVSFNPDTQQWDEVDAHRRVRISKQLERNRENRGIVYPPETQRVAPAFLEQEAERRRQLFQNVEEHNKNIEKEIFNDEKDNEKDE